MRYIWLLNLYKILQIPSWLQTEKISQEESDIGYIIREETVVKGQNYKNGMVKIKNEGEKSCKRRFCF